MTRTSSRGFTMIELMITAAIVGLLSSVIITSLATARAKARDSQRLQDLRSLQTALEGYRNDHGTYPVTDTAYYPPLFWGNCSGLGGHGTTGANGWIPNLAPAYIPILPLDPRPKPPNNCYVYASDGNDYMVMAYGTVEAFISSTNPNLDTNPANRAASLSEPDFAFSTPGARLW